MDYTQPTWMDEDYSPATDREYWEDQMDVDTPPLFEGCDCKKFDAMSDIFEDWLELVVREHEFYGQYSDYLIGRFRCPFCGQKFWVYEEGPYEGHCAHEMDYDWPYEEPPAQWMDVD